MAKALGSFSGLRLRDFELPYVVSGQKHRSLRPGAVSDQAFADCLVVLVRGAEHLGEYVDILACDGDDCAEHARYAERWGCAARG